MVSLQRLHQGDQLVHVSPPIVLDTNVLVAGACRHELSLAYLLLMAILNRRIPLMLTEGIIA